jgi:predicted RNase H-like HicB family nuclease
MESLSFTVHLFKERDMYVAHVPELDLSSCGETLEQVRANIQDAVRGFVEAAERKGTLGEILEEAGYEICGEEWKAPEYLGLQRVTMSL